jgi:dTDP-4-dehydrorhamnose 3,5-epimerase-like enzyme
MLSNLVHTSIEGLIINLNKVVADERGYLAEMMPGGLLNPFCKNGFKNLYLSVATKKGVARGGHYHKSPDSFENFYCVSGVALWFFYDFRQNSKSYDKSEVVIVGEKKIAENINKDLFKKTNHKYFLPEVMAQILVPPGVYHIYIPLSNEPVKIVATHSKSYDPSDYEKVNIENIPNSDKILSDFGLK